MNLFTAEVRLDAAPIAVSSAQGQRLYVLSAQGTVFELDKKTLRCVRKTRIESFENNQLHRYSKAGAIAKDFRLLCAVPKKNIHFIFPHSYPAPKRSAPTLAEPKFV